MNKQIRARCRQIIYGSPLLFLLVGMAAGRPSLLTERPHPGNEGWLLGFGTPGFFMTLLSLVLSSAVNACVARFYMRAYNRGKPEAQDILFVFSLGDKLSTFFGVMVCYFFLDVAVAVVLFLINLLARFLPLLLIITIPLTIIVEAIVNFGLSVVWYLFAVNPGYPTRYYFKAAFEYIRSRFWEYFGFMIGTIFSALPVILVVMLLAILLAFLSGIIGLVGGGFINAYVRLCCAGYVNRIIPDEWFAGTAKF